MKIIIWIIIIIAILIGGFYWLNNYIYNEKQVATASDYKDAEYIIEGQRIKLKDADYFGNELKTDLNNDGREDIVFIVTQQPGGSGTFYYVVAALNTENGYVGSDGVLLGDRIAPQTTEKGKGNIIVVNYAERKPGESFATKPSVGKSLWLLLDPVSMRFGEVAQDFEGEADPSRMTLDMKKWTWVMANFSDGSEVKPLKAGAFTIEFSKDGRFSATTDCNRVSGSYSTNQGTIAFTNMISTKMFCEGSQENEFINLLEDSVVYHFTSNGWLMLDLKFDTGSVTFR